MSYDYGTVEVAVHGPAEKLQKLEQTLLACLDEIYLEEGAEELVAREVESLAEGLSWPVKKAKAAPEKEMTVEDNIFSETTPHELIDCLSAAAATLPELAMAVKAEISNSVTDTPWYEAYYSAAGEDGLADVDVATKTWITMPVLDVNGKREYLNLYDLLEAECWWLAEVETEEIRYWLETNRYHLLLKFTPYPEEHYAPLASLLDVTVQEMIDMDEGMPTGEWERVADWFRLNDNEAIQYKVSALEAEFDGKYRFETFLRGTEPEDAYPDEFILGVFRLLLPEVPITIRRKDGKPYYFDDQGNAYYFGKSILIDDETGFIEREVHPQFPPEANWLPEGWR